MNPLEMFHAGPDPAECGLPSAGGPARHSQGCPQCFGRLLYDGRGYSCLACAYTCPLLGHPTVAAKGRARWGSGRAANPGT